MISDIDQRRLRDVAAALALPAPVTAEQRDVQVQQVSDAIAAAQSTDDLGSPEANEKSARDHDALWVRLDRLRSMKFGDASAERRS